MSTTITSDKGWPMSITVEQMVQREVYACVSSLVSTLAQGYSEITVRDLSTLAEQAFELSCPIPDYEDAARDHGFIPHGDKITTAEEAGDEQHVWDTWQEACESEGIDPYDREVYEHWVVSDWLAQRLECKGEKVDHDFAGLCVWARTTTGQAIAADDVILRIHAKLVS